MGGRWLEDHRRSGAVLGTLCRRLVPKHHLGLGALGAAVTSFASSCKRAIALLVLLNAHKLASGRFPRAAFVNTVAALAQSALPVSRCVYTMLVALHWGRVPLHLLRSREALHATSRPPIRVL